MLTALIIITLLSLLIATEDEPAGSPVELANEVPLRPKTKPGGPNGGNSDQLAA